MKIIKQGSRRKVAQTRYFQCNVCGCEFEADYGEYQLVSIEATIRDYVVAKCKCPFCRQMAYAYL